MEARTRMLALVAILLMVTAGLLPAAPVASDTAARGPVNNTDSEPNDDKANATIVDSGLPIEGAIEGSDHVDMYKFQLTNSGGTAQKAAIDVVFDHQRPLVSIYLRDEEDFLIDFMRDTPNTDLYAMGTKASAWYYLTIKDDSLLGETYNVTITISTVTFTGDANNAPSEAVVVSQFPYHINSTADGDTEPMDHQDFYKVSLKRTISKADLLMAFMRQESTAQFWIEVYNEALGNTANPKESDPPPGIDRVHSYGAEAPGFYYIRVWAANGTGWYDLTLDVVEITLDDNNNDAANATAIVLTDHHYATFSGDVGEGLDIFDLYSLEVMEGQVMNATITSNDYNTSTRLPKMHMAFLEDDATTPYDTDPNMTDDLLDPVGFTNASAPQEGTNINFIKIFVDNFASGGGSYTVDLFTDRVPVVDDGLVGDINISESTADNPTSDTSIKLAQLFTDPDPVDDLTFSYHIVSDTGMDDASNFTVTIGEDADSTVTLAPVPAAVGEIGYRGNGLISFTATDPFGMNATATFYIKVQGTNHAPFVKYPYNETGEFADPIVLVFDETELLPYDILKGFGDPDLNDQINFEANGSSPDVEDKVYTYSSIQDRYFLKSMKLNESFIVAFDLKPNLIDHKGTITVRLDNDSPKVQDAKAKGTALEEEVWFWAYDNGEPSKWSDRAIKLLLQATSPNGTPPKWSKGLTTISFNEDESYTIDLDTVSTDIDGKDQDARTYTVTNTTTDLVVDKLDRSRFMFSAKKDWHGTVKNVVLNCTDTYGLYKTHTIDVVVVAVPDPPIKNSTSPAEDAAITIAEGTSQVLKIDVTDVDSDPVTDLEYNWTLDGNWLRTVVGATYTYQPGYDDAGSHAISVLVSERENPELNLTASWNVTVTNVNRPPINVRIEDPTNGQIFKVKTLVTLRARTASDPDVEDTVSYTWKLDGTDLASGQSYETKNLKVGDHVVTLEVSDGDLTVIDQVNITVRKENEVDGGLDMTSIGLILVVLIIVILVVAVAMRGKKERPVKDEEPDIYAADRAAKRAERKKERKKEREEEEEEEKDEEE